MSKEKQNEFLKKSGLTKEELKGVKDSLLGVYVKLSRVYDFVEKDEYLDVLNGGTRTQELYLDVFKTSFDEEIANLFEQVEVFGNFFGEYGVVSDTKSDFEEALQGTIVHLKELSTLAAKSNPVDYVLKNMSEVVNAYGESEGEYEYEMFAEGINTFSKKFKAFADEYVSEMKK